MTAPANDNFANAELLIGSSGSVGPVTIDDATIEVGEDEALPGWPHKTIWYKWVATATGNVYFSTEGSLAGDALSSDGDTANWPPFGSLDTRIAVWTGTVLGSLTNVPGGDEIGYNDDSSSGGGDYWSKVTFPVTGGNT